MQGGGVGGEEEGLRGEGVEEGRGVNFGLEAVGECEFGNLGRMGSVRVMWVDVHDVPVRWRDCNLALYLACCGRSGFDYAICAARI